MRQELVVCDIEHGTQLTACRLEPDAKLRLSEAEVERRHEDAIAARLARAESIHSQTISEREVTNREPSANADDLEGRARP